MTRGIVCTAKPLNTLDNNEPVKNADSLQSINQSDAVKIKEMRPNTVLSPEHYVCARFPRQKKKKNGRHKSTSSRRGTSAPEARPSVPYSGLTRIC